MLHASKRKEETCWGYTLIKNGYWPRRSQKPTNQTESESGLQPIVQQSDMEFLAYSLFGFRVEYYVWMVVKQSVYFRKGIFSGEWGTSLVMRGVVHFV